MIHALHSALILGLGTDPGEAGLFVNHKPKHTPELQRDSYSLVGQILAKPTPRDGLDVDEALSLESGRDASSNHR